MSAGDGFPGFDRPVARDGYAWWYLDALSDDGRHALTVIVFVGSVFSPYYAGARRRGDGDPAHHCAVNVALYGARGKRWCLTERGRGQLARDATRLRIGPSAVRWDADALVVDVDEITVPWPSRIRGRITVHPSALTGHTAALDAAGRHRWSPVAPRARVEVRLRRPGLAWSGDGYLDSNAGDEPLERAFRCWDWSRASVRDGAALLYDVVPHGGARRTLALAVDRHGAVQPFDAPPPARLASTPLWRIRRATLAPADANAAIDRTLEDTPFYARSTLRTRLLGETVTAMHESLDLDRFARRWVQMLLPFRMPRVTRPHGAGPAREPLPPPAR